MAPAAEEGRVFFLKGAGEDFLELMLSDSIGSNLDQQDSRTYQPPSRRSRASQT